MMNVIHTSRAPARSPFRTSGFRHPCRRGDRQNNLNRWYDPSVGKWMSEDAIGFEAKDANLHRFVGNAPVVTRDPSGLQSDPKLATLFGAFSTEVEVLEHWGQQVSQMGSGVDMTITFTPNTKACPCKRISFIQTLHSFYTKSGTFYNPHTVGLRAPSPDPLYEDIVGHRTTGAEGAGVVADVMLDVYPKKFRGGKPTFYFTDTLDRRYRKQDGFVFPESRVVQWSNTLPSPHGCPSRADVPRAVSWERPARYRPAIMQDVPKVGVDVKASVTYEFETSAVCRETGKFLGTLNWGFVTVGGGKVGATLLPITASTTPSATHSAAIANMEAAWKMTVAKP